MLGPAGQNLSDEEILKIRDAMWELAEIIYETKIKPKLDNHTRPSRSEPNVVA